MTKQELLEHWRTVKAKKRNQQTTRICDLLYGNSNRKEFDSLLILQVDCDKPDIVVEE